MDTTLDLPTVDQGRYAYASRGMHMHELWDISGMSHSYPLSITPSSHPPVTTSGVLREWVDPLSGIPLEWIHVGHVDSGQPLRYAQLVVPHPMTLRVVSWDILLMSLSSPTGTPRELHPHPLHIKATP